MIGVAIAVGGGGSIAIVVVIALAIRGGNRWKPPRYPLRRGSGQNVRRLRALPSP